MEKIKTYIFGFLIIFLVYYFSIYILKILNASFPAPVFGILVLFLLLKFNIVPEKYIKDTCSFLLKYMILFFIPITVGIMNYFDIIYQNLLPIVFTVFITTFLVIITVGLFVENAVKLKRLYAIKRGKNG